MSGYKTGGFEERFLVIRRDGQPICPQARYIVLDYGGNDPHAVTALNLYADLVESENPQFAEGIRAAIAEPETGPVQHF